MELTMIYQRILDKINAKALTRADLRKTLINAENKFKNGDKDAAVIIDAITIATPSDKEI